MGATSAIYQRQDNDTAKFIILSLSLVLVLLMYICKVAFVQINILAVCGFHNFGFLINLPLVLMKPHLQLTTNIYSYLNHDSEVG